MPIDKILIVDNDPIMRQFLQETLHHKHMEVLEAESGEQAMEILKSQSFDMVITDMKIGKKITGIDLLITVKELSPKAIVVIITGAGSVETAVEAMRLGAFNYLIKPFSPETIETLIDKARQQLLLLQENDYLRQQLRKQHEIEEIGTASIIANSPTFKKILADAIQIAKSNANVFIHGESGTGKEVIAHIIHYNSLRKDKPFIKVNCAAVPDSLIESEFFGHEKGSFTGATAKHAGRFELAHGGTLLLDEVTEIPLQLQAKLLRVIQEHEFERIGGTKAIKVDVRLISTSNRDIKEAHTNKILREDLYYRLNVVPIYIPPLRERAEDILPLAEHFLKKVCFENHEDPHKKSFTPESKQKLLSYSWPGNVRELANVIERAVVMDNDNVIAPEHLNIDSSTSGTQATITMQVGTPLHLLEKQMIIETLHSQQNNAMKAAELLGISPRKLRSKLASYEK